MDFRQYLAKIPSSFKKTWKEKAWSETHLNHLDKAFALCLNNRKTVIGLLSRGKLYIKDFTHNYELRDICTIDDVNGLVDLQVVNEDIVLIFKNTLRVFQFDIKEFKTEISFQEQSIFTFAKIGSEEESIDHVLLLNGPTGSTHLLLKGLAVVAKFDNESKIQNVIVNQSKSY